VFVPALNHAGLGRLALIGHVKGLLAVMMASRRLT